MKALIIVFLSAISAHAQITSTIHYGARGVHHNCISYGDAGYNPSRPWMFGTLHPSGMFCFDNPLDWSTSTDGSSLSGALSVPFQPMVHRMHHAGPLYEAVSFTANCSGATRERAAASHDCQLIATAPPGSGYGIPNLDSFMTQSDTYTSPPDSGGPWAVATSSAMNLSYPSEVAPMGGAISLPGGNLTLITAPETTWSVSSTASVVANSAGNSSASMQTRMALRRLNAESCSDVPRVSLVQSIDAANSLSWMCAPWVGFVEMRDPSLMARAEAVRLLFAQIPALRERAIAISWVSEIAGETSAHQSVWEQSLLGRAFAARLARRLQ